MSSAEKLVGVVKAASQAIESWFAVGNPGLAFESVAGARRPATCTPEVEREAVGLTRTVPDPVLRVVSDRVCRHWDAYERALGEGVSKEQAQEIHFALLACVNKELENLRQHESQLPPGSMTRWWVEYS